MKRTRTVCPWAIVAFAVCVLTIALPVQARTVVHPSQTGPEHTGATEAGRITAIQNLYQLPLSFAENQGQWDKSVRFRARTRNGELSVCRDEAVLAVPVGPDTAQAIRLRPLGVRKNADPRPGRQVATSTNFFLDNDPSKWRTNVPTYDSVVYQDLYPGIDLRYHGDNHLLEYDFLVASGADPARIRLGLQGARSVRLEADGAMVLTLPGGRELRQAAPMIYQEYEGVKKTIAGKFKLFSGQSGQGQVFGFELAAYDRTRPLVIDPTLTYSTYLGGTANDFAYAVSVLVDPSGLSHAIVAGSTLSTTFPKATNASGTVRGQADVFVARFNPLGTALEFSTIIGGSLAEEARGVAVNNVQASDYYQCVYVTGYTKSTNFPVASALWPALSGSKEDAFILALTPSGTALLFSTYYGGSGSDFGNAIAMDYAGNPYVGGSATSTDLPVIHALYPHNSGGVDGFFLKMNQAGNTLQYASYFGAEKDDSINALAVTANDEALFSSDGEVVSTDGSLYIAGSTLSTGLPTKNAIWSTIGSITNKDGFVARINPAGTELVFSTYLGGAKDDWVNGIAVDLENNVIVTGGTSSTNFPTANALFPALAGVSNAFVTKLDGSGRYLRFSTYLGGAGSDEGKAVAVDQDAASGFNIYVGGSTTSANFPTTNAWTGQTAAGVVQIGNGNRGAGDGFIAKLDANGLGLIASSCLGGTAADAVNALATPANGMMTVFAAGQTASLSTPTGSAFPTVGDPAPIAPFQVKLGGGTADTPGQSDAFVTRFTDTTNPGYNPNTPILFLNGKDVPPATQATADLKLVYQDSTTASSNIGSISATLTYDQNVMAYTGFTPQPGLNAKIKVDVNDYHNGTLYVMIYQNSGSGDQVQLTSGTLATLNFEMESGLTPQVSRVTNSPTASDVNSSTVSIQGQAGAVRVINSCGSLLGDCDCSSVVQMWEMQMAEYMLLTILPSQACVQSNYTTPITIADMTRIISNHLQAVGSLDTRAAAMCPQNSGATPTARLSLGADRLSAGTMTVPMRLASGGASVAGIAADIVYDPAIFSNAVAQAGPAATAAHKDVLSHVSEPGKLRVVVLSTSNLGSVSDGEVAQIVLTLRNGNTRPRGTLGLTASAADPSANAVPLAGGNTSFPADAGLMPVLGMLLNPQ